MTVDDFIDILLPRNIEVSMDGRECSPHNVSSTDYREPQSTKSHVLATADREQKGA